MKTNLIIAISAWGIAIIISIVLLYLLLPSNTIRRPVDMKIVQAKEERAPFFEVAFRKEEIMATDLLVNDPYTLVRGKPLLPEIHGVGPHDLLGFRNREIPRIVDVVTIGDSHTYGINVPHSKNWPSILEQTLEASIYNMSVGGWSAPQYLYALRKALLLQPKVVIVAFYLGNDALESFKSVYAIDYWKTLRPDNDLTIEDMPSIPFPPPEDSFVFANHPNKTTMTFTPATRHISNKRDDAVVKTGYAIIKNAISLMAEESKRRDTKLYITLLPTKELVYSELTPENPKKLNIFKEMIEAETEWSNEVIETIKENAHYIDTLTHLQRASKAKHFIYPPDKDGHPLELGYQVIGKTIAQHIKSDVTQLKAGTYQVKVSEEESWYFKTNDDLTCHKLKEKPKEVSDVSFRMIEDCTLK